MVDPLVTPTWLADWIDDPEVQILDATWYLPGQDRTGAQSYAEGHIPRAIFFDIDAVSDKTVALPHMLPDPRAFADAAGALGLRRDCIIVVYDAQGLFSAPRVWWTLRAMGFPEVFVLDGGLKAWAAEGRPISRTPHALPPVAMTSRFQPHLVRDLEEVRSALETRSAQVVDARPAARFRGEAPEPRQGLRAGHMPGARNIPWDSVVNADGTMKSASELREVFKSGGVDPSGPIVTTCGSGVSAAILALALARMGVKDVPIYDGSWSEWGAAANTPVMTGA